ncbi:MAG: hypothetical protein ACO3JG_08360, partial [Luteolibacter sp.]
MNLIPRIPNRPRGFALVTTISLMVLLAVMCVGLMGLSAVSLRASTQTQAQAEAQANARVALLVALGELQKEMGPDMRISAEAAIFDTNEDSETIEGVAQSRWVASYDSWGDWLNTEYTHPEKGQTLEIQDTYTARRENMFRRWLLSLPPGKHTDINAPDNIPGASDSNWVKLVGKGSLGFDDETPGLTAEQQNKLHSVTRAYLTPVGESGRHAWWISPENHKARVDKAMKPRTLDTYQWQTA